MLPTQQSFFSVIRIPGFCEPPLSYILRMTEGPLYFKASPD